MKKRLLLLMMMAGGTIMLPAQEPGEMEVTDIETAAIEQTDTDLVAIEQTDAATIEQADTIALDPDPEWYVAPIKLEEINLAPRRATANNCPTDSVLTYDEHSVLTDVSIYEYGDTIRTITWAVNPDGTRTGKALIEEYKTATVVYNGSYDWDQTTNNWKGASKTVKEYNAKGKQIANTTFAWVNNAWIEDVKLTYAYDESDREIEFLTYNHNKSTNQLELSKGRYREWYNASKTTSDIQYTAYSNGKPTAGNKKEYEYDTFGNQSKYVYYSSYSNGNWIGSTYEEWEYATKTQKTLYIKKTWSNGSWVNNTKEVWAYYGTTTNFTLHEKYSGSGNNWNITLQEIKEYNESGKNTLIENYSFTNGVKKGTKKESYVYYGNTNNKTSTLTYTWVAANADWAYNKKSINERNNFGIIDSYNELWSNGEWVGSGTRTLTTYIASNKPTNVVKQAWSTTDKAWVNSTQTLTTYNGSNVTEVIDQTWSTTENAWVNSKRTTTDYSGTKTTQRATYVWSTEINDWVGTGRSDWHYNAAGLEDTISTYRPIGTIWVDSLRTVKKYDAQNNNILTHNAKWNGEKWVMTSMTRRDIKDDTVDGIRQTLDASWRCESDSIWIGVQKDSAAYLASGKLLYKTHCDSWQNGDWVPSYKVEFEYDDAGNTLLQQQLDWNTSSAQWVGFYRYEHKYDAEGRQIASATYNNWNASNQSWIGTSKTGTVYNSDGSVRESIDYSWENNDWVYSKKYIYDYDSEQRMSRYIFQLYTNGEWTNSLKNEKDYFGETISKDNTFTWLNGEWSWKSRNEQYYDDDAQAKLRRDIQGSWDEKGVKLSFVDNIYSYACDPRYYTIRFVNYDGKELSSEKVLQNNVPSYTGETPVKPATAQYTYTFKGWTPEIVAVVGAATYTAEFDSTTNAYLITFVNGADTLQSTEIAYGETPAYAGEAPTKPATDQYTYTFKGWTPEIVAVTGNATYTAEYDSIKNTCLITFKNGEEVLQSTEVAYGETPAYAGEAPTKPATAQYTYTFKEWTPEIVAVAGPATYTAEFDSVVNRYRITWLDADDAGIGADSLEYGAMPSHEDVVKAKTAEWTYSFVGWTPTITSVTGDATYKAQLDSVRNSYLVTFVNGADTLQSTEVAYGETPAYAGEAPTKPATAQYTYTFKGWTPEIVAVAGTATYTAEFDSTANAYLITFVNGEEILQSTEVAYGETPAYAGENPTKPATAQYTYTFKGWTPEIVAVAGAATYTAEFDSTTNAYLISFINGEEILQSTEVAYGETPAYAGEKPTKAATAQCTYTFKGWTPEIVAVAGRATYTAEFDSTTNAYLISFVNGEEILQSTEVAYGETPAYAGETPTKAATAQCTYTFKGWTPEIVAVAGQATYTAEFDSTVNNYLITFVNGEEILQSTEVAYGETPEYNGEAPTKAATAQYTYTFKGWTPEIVAVAGQATYTADFDSVAVTYLITFKNGEKVLQSTEVAYGEMPVYTGKTPTKFETAQYSYVFKGWNPDVVPVTGEATYTAEFDSLINAYLVIFYDEDSLTVLDSVTLEYGTMPATEVVPTKEEDAQYTYTFAGWTPEMEPITGDAVYIATYEATEKTQTGFEQTGDGKSEDGKFMRDGIIYIRRGDKIYTIDGILQE